MDNQYKRGCVRDLHENTQTLCGKQLATCKTCKGKDCNIKKDFQTCMYCNSKDDIECSRNTTLTESILCQNYLATCLVGIDSHGHTHRRCSKEYSEETIEFPNDQFKVCRENKCNTYIYPADRLQCYQCNGEKECDFMSSKNSSIKFEPLTCVIASKLDQCYAYLSRGN